MTVASAVAAAVLALGLASDVDSSDFRYTRTLTAPAGVAVSFEPDGQDVLKMYVFDTLTGAVDRSLLAADGDLFHAHLDGDGSVLAF